MTKEIITGNEMHICYATVHELEECMKSKELCADYTALDETWKKRFEDYMTGRKTMPLTYDPFFKRIFNPDIHPEWLSGLLSAIIGENVTVEDVLPSEDTAISIDSLLIMDIIVRLADGALANVEIQKIPYQFAAERISCYSSDLLLREYTRLKQNKNFMYSDMKKVYTIVLFEKSSTVFKDSKLNGVYLNHGKTRFDSGLKLEMLQEYFMIALDVFCENGYTEDTDLDGWLSILTAETMADVERVIRHYPWSKAIFHEMGEYVRNPKEVLLMFSEALKIADKNTVKYMMEELQDKVSELEEERKRAENKQRQAEEKLQQAEAELVKLRAQLKGNE